jgi:hypothetical protein
MRDLRQEAEVPDMDAASWEDQLSLHDEPHGDEYFIVDHSTAPPTWYRLDGSVWSWHDGVTVRPPGEIARAAAAHGWTLKQLLHP